MQGKILDLEIKHNLRKKKLHNLLGSCFSKRDILKTSIQKRNTFSAFCGASVWRLRLQFIVIILKKSNKQSRWLREELPFVLDSSFKNSGEARLCFRFLFIQCFISFSLSTHIFLCTIFDAVSSNLHKVPRINPGKPVLLELIDLVNSFRSSNDLQMLSRALFGSLTIILAVLQF